MKDIRHLTDSELVSFLESVNEKKFRAKQIAEWLWKKGARSFDEMSNLSVSLRSVLVAQFSFQVANIEDEVKAGDGTVKFVFRLHDGQKVEGVLIPSAGRVTACISSQVGCPLRCAFCATGTMGFIRQLHHTEIFDQYTLMNEKAISYFGKPISNIVYMGMGEPLLNYDNVMRSVEILTAPWGQQLSPSRITLSTAGVAPAIRRLADDGFKAGLAVSLHCADELKRAQLMPVTELHPLKTLQEALSYYHSKTNERITIEYLLLNGLNDSTEDARKLWEFCKPFPVKINIIEYNATGGKFSPSPAYRLEAFVNYLTAKNMVVNIRRSKGKDAQAACGQLVQKRLKIEN
ncbi:MAG: 23S rRNA (adenine(2503)-C(2))-methyltransferase RlmN [Bacteroidales bacterium]|nr:23S rRNA (adenine(2503)-C(2))-methyltransferase RlmN [Bacteroidales bacterium]